MERHPSTASVANRQTLPALSGIRFFAIFHIYVFHLWSLYDMEHPEGFENVMADFGRLPDVLVTFLSQGWMSTSFFFLLSGFILSYLYWGPDGKLSTSPRRFWVMRFTRLYPIHMVLIILAILMMMPMHLSRGMGWGELVPSALASLTLTQSWYAPWVPMWSWPTWALSTLVFLYLIMPWLMRVMSGLDRRQMFRLLLAMPLISLVPTMIFTLFFPPGTEAPLNWQIFIGSTPLFWVPHFAAGMLLSRVFSISRFNPDFKGSTGRWWAWGDLALVTVIVIACLPGIGDTLKFFLRHGLVMPLYLVLILDLARGNGLAARIFSLRGMNFLGETGFSIFIWQNMVMTACFVAVMINPQWGNGQLLWAIIGMLLIAIPSTYLLEKPLAERLRKRWLKEK
ncbi:acyltransferase [Marinimicrobium sp. ABcell2]|uniref:acyltransferase family protein n=1 Tax=Marinimicrobium sp. ABcell2 TaxID=3069751 RepID=UPI0027B5FA80|nr:acyltransferase [Marinimicrobium sp. ABcell2]MDQ2078371.1 acyltransferase [Marinimicrobium sp. ABcell2]